MQPNTLFLLGFAYTRLTSDISLPSAFILSYILYYKLQIKAFVGVLIMNKDRMKVIAYYLPQYHIIDENEKFWGKGFTEWVSVKNAKPLYEGHLQPRKPLNDNYYNLLDDSIKQWQIELAKKYGIYGFCFYHYWFNGKLLLEKPIEQFFENKNCDLHFCLSWANEPWTDVWVKDKGSTVLIEQKYGNQDDWKMHYAYISKFFKDDRSIKVNGKPLFIIYRAGIISRLNEMLDFWNLLAVEDGFPGLSFAYQNLYNGKPQAPDESRFDYNIFFEPNYAFYDLNKKNFKVLRSIKMLLANFCEKYTKLNLRAISPPKKSVAMIDYDKAWESIINRIPFNNKCIPGAFTNWDNTPRRGVKGLVYNGSTPEKFQKYLSIQIQNAIKIYKKDMLFLFAWNEWSEGGFLEPDEYYEYGYLNAVKNALEDNGVFPEKEIVHN